MSSKRTKPCPSEEKAGNRGFTVIDPGWASRVVDVGRPGTRSLGVPVGGAADRASWMLGNALVGNSPESPALEIAVKGPILRAECELGCVVYGAPFVLSSARQSLRMGRTFTLAPGEELHIGGAPVCMRAYLCVPGGFQVPMILGSASALDLLRRGDTLTCVSSRLGSRFIERDPGFEEWTASATLRFVPGPQADWFDAAQFSAQSFVISPASNRMGLRLQGKPLTMPVRELLSEPVCPGSVQVTKDGQCIILGVDGQTIGGYPKIAQVIRADLDALGQIRPGAKVRFQQVDLKTALELDQQRRQMLNEWTTRMRVSIGATQ